MDPHSRKKLQQHTTEEGRHEQEVLSQQQQNEREFETVEDMLRHDRATTAMPPHIATRVRDSMAAETAQKSWWQRIWGR